MDKRLQKEINLLYAGEAAYKLPAAPIINQLLADASRSLPDNLPNPPAWTSFNWTGDLNFTDYWRNYDRVRAV